MKRCVITGAGGLIGSALVEILASGWEIHAVSRHRPAKLPARNNLVWHSTDVSAAMANGALPEQTDAVIYLAQSEHFRDFPDRALDIFDVNTIAVLRYLDYARRAGARTFVYASSGGVYGWGDTSMSETASIPAEGNLGFYLGSKLCSEIVALNYASFMNVAILRFFFAYGPGQRKSMLIPRLADAVRTGSPVTLQGEDGIRLNPVHVTEAADAVARSLDLKGTHKINVAGPEILSLRQMCEIIGKAVGRKPVYKIEDVAPKHIVGDTARMTELLAAPRISFLEGFQTMLRETDE
jgi:nucleoside-diphosphate-sugar epimerase